MELCSKGPGRKGNPPIRERISGPISDFMIYFYILAIGEFQSKNPLELSFTAVAKINDDANQS